MSSPESVSSRIASSGARIAIWSISSRFFSPPEKPSFTYRVANAGSMWRSAIFSSISLRNLASGMPVYLIDFSPSASAGFGWWTAL